MIFGECPYDGCGGSFTMPIDRYGFQKHWCEKCKKLIWTLMSRIDPKSYTEESFLEHYKVDEETKNITEI
jgi:hypothetical protein